MSSSFPYGSSALIRFEFRSLADDELFDPDEVRLVLKRPGTDGAEETLSGDDITNVSTGVYTCVVGPLDAGGTWTYAPIGIDSEIPSIRREYELHVCHTKFADPMGEDS